MTSSDRPDAIVIGAGIVGVACAAALARDGRKVVVVERSFAASGATAAAMGHVVAMDDSPEQLALTAYAGKLWRDIAPYLDARAELDPCGTLWVAEDDDQRRALLARQRTYSAAGVACEVLDTRSVADAEPNLRRGLTGALRVPHDAVVYPPGAALRLLDIARSYGAVLREDAEVLEIVPNGVRLAGETLSADVVVNAAGAAAPKLTPQLPIIPRKGHLAITDRYPGFCRHQIVEVGYLTSAHVMTEESVAFNVQPRATGQILIGSSRELAGWNAAVNRDILRRMLARAVSFMPALAGLNVLRSWTGFRPATSDKLPMIGPWAPVPGLWIAAGHEGLGITTALATAELIADQVAGRYTHIDPAPYLPMRALELSVPVCT